MLSFNNETNIDLIGKYFGTLDNKELLKICSN